MSLNVRRFVTVVLILMLVLPGEAMARRHKKRAPARKLPTAISALLIDTTDNKYYYAKNIDHRIFPASTTKVLTSLIAIEKLPLDQYVTVSTKAVNVPETKLNFKPGEQYKVGDLIYAALLKSANDAANVLAEAVAGSQAEFVTMMNAKAVSLGATHSHFANAHGLPSEDEQYTTARDMMVIFRAALKNPYFRKVISFKYRILYSKDGRRLFLKSHNKSLFLNWKKDVLGKTGYTREAQSCFVGFFEKNGHEYIVDVFGCSKRWEDIKFIIERYAAVDL